MVPLWELFSDQFYKSPTMKIVLFCHPDFLNSTSMPLFANMIREGMLARGISVECWAPKPFFHRIPASYLQKWMGYIDQFIVFPIQARTRLKKLPKSTLFVFSDQALGPWVPLVKNRPHVVHCHDFLALRSSLGEFPQNPTSWSGKIYQKWIRHGFNQASNFICVSHRSAKDLNLFLDNPQSASIEVVHNPLDSFFRPMLAEEANNLLTSQNISGLERGFILHVGGNQWYKNREGVVAVYAAYVRQNTSPLPLVMIGAPPSKQLQDAANSIGNKGNVKFLIRPESKVVKAAYSTASAMLFPSFAEGFGWPIIEAMACGCPVLTTNDAPMTEAGGSAANYIPKFDAENVDVWAKTCADILGSVLRRSPSERLAFREAGLAHAGRFDNNSVIDRYLSIYENVMSQRNT